MTRETRRLEWVRRNRGERKGAEAIGVWAAWVVSHQLTALPAWRRRLLGLLEECLGADWQSCVVEVELRDGVLRLGVSEPARLYHLRLRWEQHLLDVLRAELPAAGIHTIRWFIVDRADDVEGQLD
ncbi:MAG TPA: DciA family protein [Phycisphaerae bacterium]|nr:DciA family protein [Phycisphaerae bacterium]HRY67553.1 DciA family protein [Phycisphaerae bacterium]HSA24940.1 DciA family protein [Phycisphaerae bacterium]